MPPFNIFTLYATPPLLQQLQALKRVRTIWHILMKRGRQIELMIRLRRVLWSQCLSPRCVCTADFPAEAHFRKLSPKLLSQCTRVCRKLTDGRAIVEPPLKTPSTSSILGSKACSLVFELGLPSLPSSVFCTHIRASFHVPMCRGSSFQFSSVL